MKQQMTDIAHKVFLSVLMAAGMLSIASVDSLWDRQAHSFHEMKQARRSKARANKPFEAQGVKSQVGSSLSQLRESFYQDEFNEEKPFASLLDHEVLEIVNQKGVKNFVRQAYRSPKYQGESGYDMLNYAIEHDDGTRTFALAYLEGFVPVVSVFVGDGLQARSFLFRANELVGHSTLPTNEAQALVDQKVDHGVPFLSVSR